MTIVERFRLRVIGLLEDRGLTQKAIRGSKTEGWVSNIITGRRGIRLNDVEQIADALNVPVAELMRRPEDHVYDLSQTESRLIEAFRKLSHHEQQALLTMATLRFRRVGRPSNKPDGHANRHAAHNLSMGDG
jgi:transcriptional regulator with XRE-family HTH domain